jgi:hypothetical protein|tara:strand:+ start:457 stop:660 length:204 start_codon:yes stop_codon:yes gene_type:complete
MMWDWSHFKEEGWLSHTKRSARLALLLLASGAAMILHVLVPFWQQPKKLQRGEVACALCEGLESPQE